MDDVMSTIMVGVIAAGLVAVLVAFYFRARAIVKAADGSSPPSIPDLRNDFGGDSGHTT